MGRMRILAGSVAILALTTMPLKAQDANSLDNIRKIAATSECAKISWKDRGPTSKAYYEGIAVVFAKAVCHPNRTEVKILSSAQALPDTAEGKHDALAWYSEIFGALGMDNSRVGLDTLRHTYTLMIGLGMRESSGQYCVGRDKSADFDSSDNAEAGLFQTSWGAHKAHPVMGTLFDQYSSDQTGCYLDIFKDKFKCTEWDGQTWGQGKGAEWQKLTKACPAFATEYGGIVLRLNGGGSGEFGPIRKRKAEVKKSCDSMLQRVQDFVADNPAICSKL